MPNCPACSSLADDYSSLLPEPSDREDLAHYFYNCARVRCFWLLVSWFTRAATPHAAFSGPIDITPSDAVHGFSKWSRVLPNYSMWHWLARQGEIYCANA